jgi:hypothetical protein
MGTKALKPLAKQENRGKYFSIWLFMCMLKWHVFMIN